MDLQAIFENYKRILTQHYFDMQGRVGRPEFWYFVLANLVAAILAGLIGNMIGLPLGPLYNLAVLLPSTSLGARRLQDIGRNGQLVWVMFILVAISQVAAFLTMITFFAMGPIGLLFLPGATLIGLACFVMALVLIWFWCQPGDAGANAYGPPPPVFDPRARVV